MIPAHSLQNKTVMIPRGKAHAKSFSELVARNGGIPVEIPLIAFQPVAASEKLLKTLANLHTYDWIIFTSNVTVETFYTFLKKGQALPPKIAVIGEKTKKVLLDMGETVDFVPEEYVAEGFIDEFLPHVNQGERVLIPKGNLARDYISAALKEKGAIVDEIIIYETFMPDESRSKLVKMLSEESLDILTFTSPSTIDHFMKIVEENQLRDKLEHRIVACIGPVSKRKAEQRGLKVHAMPEKYTVEEMLKSVAKFINIGG
ncbi:MULTISPECIES: uroporphyrinogen-III synthase [unclassified Bacillus (in: firmicutes)]|uniref:uroporphyrinogen-III synthase n=1 Tax=unclassified Bacillus (in: firmicutes) TaxID=185979 RepID=UPI001BE84A79|nr:MULTISPECIES: uroporphyrinogen-III synthase [unclassified Bacillus (in: firmicutes)]MBT2636334.1 uroporphyrinogen-III synthase [Bacillus sp. ISL-39]MBT2660615.1 uroporphyrinogen-III synthase [Bacillus sp. ISL-45]